MVRGPELTEPSSYGGKSDQECFLLYTSVPMCCTTCSVTNTGCVLFERLCNRNCHTAVLSEVGYICQISHIKYLDYFL